MENFQRTVYYTQGNLPDVVTWVQMDFLPNITINILISESLYMVIIGVQGIEVVGENHIMTQYNMYQDNQPSLCVSVHHSLSTFVRVITNIDNYTIVVEDIPLMNTLDNLLTPPPSPNNEDGNNWYQLNNQAEAAEAEDALTIEVESENGDVVLMQEIINISDDDDDDVVIISDDDDDELLGINFDENDYVMADELINETDFL